MNCPENILIPTQRGPQSIFGASRAEFHCHERLAGYVAGSDNDPFHGCHPYWAAFRTAQFLPVSQAEVTGDDAAVQQVSSRAFELLLEDNLFGSRDDVR